MDRNKFFYWKNIRKLKFDIEKCIVLHSGFKNIKVEYRLRNKEVKKVNAECDLGVGFKADNNIMSLLLRSKGMICRMVKNFISEETSVVLKIYKTSLRVFYFGLDIEIGE